MRTLSSIWLQDRVRQIEISEAQSIFKSSVEETIEAQKRAAVDDCKAVPTDTTQD